MKNKNVSIGVSYGIIIGLVYCILLFIRWSQASNLILFGIFAVLNFLVVLGIMFYEAYYRRKQEGGFIDLKNLLQTLFISVLIFEAFYSLYNFVHLKFIDPNVVEEMKAGLSKTLDQAGSGLSEEKKAESLSSMDELKKATDILQMLKGYLFGIAVSGVFALMIAAIMKKKKPVFTEFN